MLLVLRRWLPIALIALVALWLRTRDLAARPMHSDEANQAVKFGELLETGHYAYDPHDHHGPTLYYAALPIAWLRGQRTLAALDEITLRLVPALFGTIAVVLVFLLATPGGDAGPAARIFPLLAAALLAVSPPAVYYSRDFIQETLLLTFVLASFVCVQRWWRSGHLRWAIASGVCMGLALSTKISAPLFLLAGLVAVLAARPLAAGASTRVARDVFAGVGAVLVTVALLYSSFGTHFAGICDAGAALVYGLHRAGGGDTGHEKPWWYYLRLFGRQRDGGLVFVQIAFTTLALAGAVLSIARRAGILRWAAIYALILGAVLSLTPYKTPWHAIHLVPGLALLAAGAIAALPKLWLSLALAAVVLAFQVKQTDLVTILRPADPRNPYAYVHSSPDVLKFRARADAALARHPGGVIRVISGEYWPLPWYFRGLPRVGYWTSPPADCDGALVIASAALAPSVRAQLHGAYDETYLGLRPGFLCVVFTPRP
ncbi:MAG TPA: flippase activity-associated protein Agl23 [Opitutus sp.]|nr:flippase activity-associated protein Agl23 [Opitutus sp.]